MSNRGYSIFGLGNHYQTGVANCQAMTEAPYPIKAMKNHRQDSVNEIGEVVQKL